MKRDARLVLPGDLVIYQGRPRPAHHVETVTSVVSDDPEVYICVAAGPHGAESWPYVGPITPGDKVDVLPKPPKVTTVWDEATGKWKVDVVEDPVP
jgi:hypothetical protein